MPHVIQGVEPGSIADQLGIAPGDVLHTINDRHPVDLIDYQAFCCEEKLSLVVERAGERRVFRFLKDEYEPLGLTFGQALMSRQRDCANECLFCFVDQLPPGARDTLRVKDDDWRMSLMMGNFVTLTNVSDAELTRIIARRASPLYISVHATDPELRSYLLGTRLGAKLMDQLKRLANAGLTFHAQAVLCPGINDGAALERTVRELAEMRPACLSLALVPVGLTGHREGLSKLRRFTPGEARAVIELAGRRRAAYMAEDGDAFVHPADEFYLIAGLDFPEDAAYGDYPQLENGVGLCRLFEREYREAWQEADFSDVVPAPAARVAIACGTSVAPFLRGILEARPVPGVEVRVYALEDGFFGPTITVSGLLTGGDLLRQLKGIEADRLLISQTMLREGGDVFLDDTTLQEIEQALGIEIHAVAGGEGLLHALSHSHPAGRTDCESGRTRPRPVGEEEKAPAQ
ncbi:MAG: DUF512 domain-containing protein [Eubacteriales bacterium]|nr:DUF512 domain-containing protein [Eubacteriales bacterium]